MEYGPSYTHNQKRALRAVKLFIRKKKKKRKKKKEVSISQELLIFIFFYKKLKFRGFKIHAINQELKNFIL